MYTKSFYLFDTKTNEVVYCTPTKNKGFYTVVIQGARKFTVSGTEAQLKTALAKRFKKLG